MSYDTKRLARDVARQAYPTSSAAEFYILRDALVRARGVRRAEFPSRDEWEEGLLTVSNIQVFILMGGRRGMQARDWQT
jgi:hypothetical protein